MALLAAFLVPADSNIAASSVAATTASGEIVTGPNMIVAVNATQDVMISFGLAGMPAPTATNFRIPANTILEIDMGQNHDRFRVWNNGASSANVYTQLFSRF